MKCAGEIRDSSLAVTQGIEEVRPVLLVQHIGHIYALQIHVLKIPEEMNRSGKILEIFLPLLTAFFQSGDRQAENHPGDVVSYAVFQNMIEMTVFRLLLRKGGREGRR